MPLQLICNAISDNKTRGLVISLEGIWQPFFWGGGLVGAATCSGHRRSPLYLQNYTVVDGKGWWRGGCFWLYLSGHARPSRVARRARPRCSLCFPCACGSCETWKATGACRGWKSAPAHNDLKRPSYTALLPPLESKKQDKKKKTCISESIALCLLYFSVHHFGLEMTAN